jgi:hypothetical protein
MSRLLPRQTTSLAGLFARGFSRVPYEKEKLLLIFTMIMATMCATGKHVKLGQISALKMKTRQHKPKVSRNFFSSHCLLELIREKLAETINREGRPFCTCKLLEISLIAGLLRIEPRWPELLRTSVSMLA